MYAFWIGPLLCIIVEYSMMSGKIIVQERLIFEKRCLLVLDKFVQRPEIVSISVIIGFEISIIWDSALHVNVIMNWFYSILKFPDRKMRQNLKPMISATPIPSPAMEISENNGSNFVPAVSVEVCSNRPQSYDSCG